MEDKHKYTCETCKLSTNYKNVFDKHLISKKHVEKNTIETASKYLHTCSKCDKSYTTYSGLWKHQKKCIEEQVKTDELKEQPTEQKEEGEQKEGEQKEEGKQKEEVKVNTIQLDGEQQPIESASDIHTKIKMNIIKILLDHVNRSELNKIIDEIYTKK